MGTTAEVDLRSQVEHEAITAKIGDVAAYLQEHLGQKMTAYLSGIDHAKTVGLWVAHKSEPRDLPSMRLRYAYRAARLLIDAYDDETARAWFFGSNTRLDDEAPAYLLRHGTSPDDLRRMIPAAYAFVEVAG
ncbi:MAG TPA: XRE family transcriptional regulator [Thermoanaerobaculia bacterium]|nr:XRE family transcriptional regulator [Thermoanaerobaculia bacterium]